MQRYNKYVKRNKETMTLRLCFVITALDSFKFLCGNHSTRVVRQIYNQLHKTSTGDVAIPITFLAACQLKDNLQGTNS